MTATALAVVLLIAAVIALPCAVRHCCTRARWRREEAECAAWPSLAVDVEVAAS